MIRTLEEREKRAIRRAKGIKKPFDGGIGPADLTVKRERDFLAPVKPGYVVKKPRGRSGTWLSPAKRAMVERRSAARKEFFAGLGVSV